MKTQQNKIGICLWFDNQAEEAAKFYTDVFKDSKIGNTNRYSKAGQEIHGKPAGSVMTVEFQLENQQFLGLNGGPLFKPNPSISFFVHRDTKEEIDALWEKLADGGQALMPLDTYPFSKRYGWVQDQYGVSWQLILASKEGDWRPSIVPSLLFVGKQFGNAEKAMGFYQSIFNNSKPGMIARYGADQKPDEEGNVMYGDFAIEGEWFAAMDSGHEHKFEFNEAISFIVKCRSQEELDYYWKNLSSDPSAEQCGWLKDRFGISWQIVPTILSNLLNNPAKQERVMQVFMEMKKIDIDTLENA